VPRRGVNLDRLAGMATQGQRHADEGPEDDWREGQQHAAAKRVMKS